MYMSSIQKRVSPESPSGVVWPMLVGQLLAERRYCGSLVRMYSFQRHDAEDVVIHVEFPGDQPLLSSSVRQGRNV